MKFQYLRTYQADQPRDVASAGSSAWSANGLQHLKTNGTYADSMYLGGGLASGPDPILLKGVHMERFQATFSVRRSHATSGRFRFVFNASDQDDYDSVSLIHRDVQEAPLGYQVENGGQSASVSGTQTVANMPTPGQTDVLWYRVESDATTVKVLCQQSATKPASWSDASHKVFTSSNFDFSNTSGMIGFGAQSYWCYVDNFELISDGNADGDFGDVEDVVVHRDDFNVNMPPGSAGYSEVIDTTDFESHDAAGNLLYDGMFAFTYDAWNRLVKVTKAYRDPEDSYNLKADMVVNTLEYDALNRRIKKAVQNSGPLDCTYHYYYDGQQIVEMHNGSEQTIQQFVWGQTYIDELVQVGLNDDPNDATEQNIETTHYALSNANYNVIGLIDDSGALVERYEYTPYGERQVYISAGLNDPDCYAPIKKSQRVQIAGIDQPWGINPVGHQGLFHDEETRLINNRRRILHPRLGRFVQTDPLGYVDGLHLYQNRVSNPNLFLDSFGLQAKAENQSPIIARWKTRVVAKSYINWFNDTGFENHPQATREQADRVRGMILLNAVNIPFTDEKGDLSRLYTEVTIKFECCKGKLTKINTSTDKKGGSEGFLLVGSIGLSDISIVREGKRIAYISWTGFGSPAPEAEWQLQAIQRRVATNIWHDVKIRIRCDFADNGYHRIDRFGGSKFPSHRLFVHGNLERTINQGKFISLWKSSRRKGPGYVE